MEEDEILLTPRRIFRPLNPSPLPHAYALHTA
jgi:hypothetical protein